MKDTLTKFIHLIPRFIDLKMGLKMAFVMGILVFLINYGITEQLLLSFIACAKQVVYTFILGGAVLKSCEHIVNSIASKRNAIIAASLIPSVITMVLVFGIHNLKGTPRPVESTFPALLVIPGTIYWAFRKRKKSPEKIQGRT